MAGFFSRHPKPDPIKPGQRSVWDFPRPPAIEPVSVGVSATLLGHPVASSMRCVRVLETSHPPVYFFPPEDVDQACFLAVGAPSFCEWKGEAEYLDVVVERGGEVRLASKAAFRYPSPTALFAPYANWISIYAGPLDECKVGDDVVTPQPGGFYSGWITPEFVGPFKGVPGSVGW